MPRKGENIYKRKDGRWEGRYIKSRTPAGKANYGYSITLTSMTSFFLDMKTLSVKLCYILRPGNAAE